LVITRATEYAVRALLYLAQQPKSQIVLKKDICHTQDVTPAFLTKILQPLIKMGIVGSQRGVGGGFYLIKDPEEVTLLDVVMAQEGDLYLNICLEEEGICNRDRFCPTHDVWREVREGMMASLARYTLAELARREKQNIQNLQNHCSTCEKS